MHNLALVLASVELTDALLVASLKVWLSFSSTGKKKTTNLNVAGLLALLKVVRATVVAHIISGGLSSGEANDSEDSKEFHLKFSTLVQFIVDSLSKLTIDLVFW